MTLILSNCLAALSSLLEQRSRAVLSAIGIMVGCAAIVLLVSIARGVQDDIRRQVKDLGVNLLIVLPAHVDDGSMLNASMMGISALSERQVADARQVPGIINGTPLCFIGGGLKHEGKTSPSTLAIAVQPVWFSMRPGEMKEGAPFNDAQCSQPVCVIGSVAEKSLFGENGKALGQKVQVNGVSYTVTGVTQDKSSDDSLFSMGSLENVMLIPYPYAKATMKNLEMNRIILQSSPDREPKDLVAAVDKCIGQTLDRESYSVVTQEDLLKLIYKLMSILTWLLVGLTSIALFVGGVGIMTVMLMSVNERTKEIGIRKTVGARGRDIFVQFLAESVVLAAMGGLAGLGISALGCWALAAFTPVKPTITWDIIGLSFGVATGVGAVFGLIPAMTAARHDPAVSLRSE